LVRAYTNAAKQALNSLKTEVKADKMQIALDMPYSMYNLVKRSMESYSIDINEEIFAEKVTLNLTILTSDLVPFSSDIQELSAGTILPVQLDD